MILEEMNITILKPENEDNWLTNGKTFGKSVCLGKYDSQENWTEITDSEKEKIEAALEEK